MILGDEDAHLAAVAAVWTAVIAGVALLVGGIAAVAANATFRLEADPRLIVRCAAESRIYWNDHEKSFCRLSPTVGVRARPSSPSQVTAIGDVPLHLIDGMPVVANGLTLHTPTEEDRPQGKPAAVWSALLIEVRNLGRSAAIQVEMTWKLSAIGTAIGWVDSGALDLKANEILGEAKVVVDGIGPNDSTFFWIANKIGLQTTLSIGSPGLQIDPLNPDSKRKKRVSLVATSIFRVAPSDYNI